VETCNALDLLLGLPINGFAVEKPRKGESLMSIIGWIIFGLIVGIIAKFLMPGRDPGGFIITTLLGIAGALVGGFLGRFLGLYGEGDPVGFIMAVLGSIVLLLIYRMASKNA
jgi:uncharacterized membrane protein YeaQ/YmgE (transglycosylase-associated protein family)